MFYKIGERLEEVKPKNFENLKYQYVAVISSEERIRNNKKFSMGIEWDINLDEITDTHVEVNIDSWMKKGSFLSTMKGLPDGL